MIQCAYDRLKHHKNKGSGTFLHHTFYWKNIKTLANCDNLSQLH